jgi:uncharacterized protein with HEPN domain
MSPPRPPGPEDRLRAEHIIALCREVQREFASVTETEYLSRRVYQTSLAWYIQAIGEAASRISDESRALAPTVQWRQIVGTRHILSHEYDRLIPQKLWKVLRVHLPPLLAAMEAALPRFPKLD